jgi:hypothetical protein
MEKLRSLHPDIPSNSLDELIIFDRSSRSDNVVLLQLSWRGSYDNVVVFDSLETKDMHTQRFGYSLLEINLPYGLQNMKIFS